MADFVHLHVHSHYSLLDGACRIEDLAERAHRFKMPALALTDHGNMFGAVEFYKACTAKGLKPIVGMEAYVAPGDRRERAGEGLKEAGHHLTLLAADSRGYHNLMKLSSTAFLDGFYYRPRIDKAVLREHAAGIVGMSGCLSGEIPTLLLSERVDQARKVAGFYREVFGKDNFFLEVQHNGIPEQDRANRGLVELSAAVGAPLVATADLHYLRREDAELHDVLLCVQTGRKLSDVSRMRFATDQFYFKSPEEMKADFAALPEAVSRSVAIAERCSLALDFKARHMPVFRPPGGESPEEYLRRLAWEGVRKRYGATPATEVAERFEREVQVLGRLGFASYYLIVWDFIRHARSIGIPVGPGRGSGAGSLVAYALWITDLDPLKYGLLFERFLNEGRNEPPDFDIDICQSRRGEVIDYVTAKYGRESVAQIVTFGTMAARAALRDAARVLEVPIPEVDRIAKLVPAEPKMTIAKALEREKELRGLYEGDARVKRLVDMARGLEGLARNCSTHAAGVVIGDRPLAELVPLYRPPGEAGEGVISTQYDMKMCGALGLLKMDFLGLQTLTVIDLACKLVEKTTGVRLDPSQFPLDEKRAYELLARGETKGVFQMESSGMTELVVRLKPDRFEDLIALVALFRPGPLGSGMVEQYVDCKHGKSRPSYRHPVMEPILRETHGVILYQEQVQALAAKMAGFTLSEGDNLRRAMGKKILEVMAQFRDKFVDGAAKNKVRKEIAEQVFQEIEFFAGYGFNKSHSACYALLAYQTAWLKAVYPVEFLAAVLTLDSGNTDKVVEYIAECGRLGIEVLPPDVNASAAGFAVESGKVRFGLGAIKGVGGKAVEVLVAARSSGGRFRDIFDFCERVDTRSCNRAVIEALIKAGAFDSTGAGRAQNSAVLDAALASGSRLARDRAQGQMTLLDAGGFGGQAAAESPRLPDVPEWSDGQRLEFEKAVLGFYLSGHPLTPYAATIRKFSTHGVRALGQAPDGADVLVGGLIASVKVTATKKDGRKMARMVLEDLEGSVEAVVFPRAYEKLGELVRPDRIVFVRGKADRKMERPSLLVDDIVPFEEARWRFAGSAVLRFASGELSDELVEALEGLLARHRGGKPVYFQVETGEGEVVTMRSGGGGIRPSNELHGELCALVGESRVEFLPDENR